MQNNPNSIDAILAGYAAIEPVRAAEVQKFIEEYGENQEQVVEPGPSSRSTGPSVPSLPLSGGARRQKKTRTKHYVRKPKANLGSTEEESDQPERADRFPKNMAFKRMRANIGRHRQVAEPQTPVEDHNEAANENATDVSCGAESWTRWKPVRFRSLAESEEAANRKKLQEALMAITEEGLEELRTSVSTKNVKCEESMRLMNIAGATGVTKPTNSVELELPEGFLNIRASDDVANMKEVARSQQLMDSEESTSSANSTNYLTLDAHLNNIGHDNWTKALSKKKKLEKRKRNLSFKSEEKTNTNKLVGFQVVAEKVEESYSAKKSAEPQTASKLKNIVQPQISGWFCDDVKLRQRITVWGQVSDSIERQIQEGNAAFSKTTIRGDGGTTGNQK